ncbi:MAG: hypothetical protein KDI68_14475 [Gammaproteobacteria bacterium]|nr:hypothetical protein [Gammaproteobacteria bacterium]
MTTRLIQKHLFKGSREFELVDDYVDVRIKAPFGREERLRVMLTVLDPEPVIGEGSLEFNSRVNGEPLLSLLLGKPDTEAFNAFVGTLKQRARDEFHAFAGLRPAAQKEAAATMLFEEPAPFDAAARQPTANKNLDAVRIGESIQLLREYLDDRDIEPLIAALEALEADPQSETLVTQAMDAFNALGSRQGAVLTYAPYVGIILADDPFSW